MTSGPGSEVDHAAIPAGVSRQSRVVITGMGLVTALGIDVDSSWRGAREGRCANGPMAGIEQPLPDGADGCQAPPLQEEFAPSLPREARYLRWTMEHALRDAGLDHELQDDVVADSPRRVAVMLGTTLHGMRAGGRFLRNDDPGALRDFLAGDTVRLALRGLRIPGFGAVTTCSACSSSLGSVALGVSLLRGGLADVVIAGGYDTVSEYVWAGFNALRLVARGPIRPFARGRAGMKLGEGYGVVILERLDEHVLARRGRTGKAFPLIVVAGWGESADAHHLTQPHPSGEGAYRAMSAAIESAGIKAGDIDLISAHATGTPDNDAAEYAALARVFGDRIGTVPVACFKSHVGHTLGGAGAVELILSAMALRENVIPVTANAIPAELEFAPLSLAQGDKDRAHGSLRFSLNSSFGFGGANTSVVLGIVDGIHPRVRVSSVTRTVRRAEPSTGASTGRQVCISGVGVLLPGAVGVEAFVRQVFDQERAPTWAAPIPPFSDGEYEHLLNARRVRRMSTYVKIMLAAATMACRGAGLLDRPDLLADTAGLLGTTHGASAFSYDYYSQVVREGVLAANPMLFAEGVPNVGAAHLSMTFGLRRGCQSIIGTRASGLDALRLAWLRVATGAVDRVIVGAAEESHFSVDRAYKHCGLQRSDESIQDAVCADPSGASAPDSTKAHAFAGFRPSQGGAALVVESLASVEARGAVPLAFLGGGCAMSGEVETLPTLIERALMLMPTNARRNIVCSSNHTWIDRAERRGIDRAVGGDAVRVGATYDSCGEVFSVTPLLGIAATLIAGRLPPRTATESRSRGLGDSHARVSIDGEPKGPITEFVSLVSDWTGLATAVWLTGVRGGTNRV